MRYMRSLTAQDVTELVDLYQWGARMSDLEMLYGCTRATIKKALRIFGVCLRPTGRVLLAVPAGHNDNNNIKSSRPRLPEGALIVDDRPTPDQLLCSSAHAQRDRRIEARRSGAKNCSCPEEAFGFRYAFLHSDTRRRDPE